MLDAAPALVDEVVADSTMKKVMCDLYAAAGLKAKQGELRDTFASCHLAKFGDIMLTAKLLGHSEKNRRTIHRYVGLVAAAVAEAFFMLTVADIIN